MKNKIFTVKESCDLIRVIQEELPNFSNYQIKTIIANKDVKINGKRVKTPQNVLSGDTVEVYYNIEEKPWFSVVYQDENILIVNKKQGIEVISDEDRSLYGILKFEYREIYCVHRIDRNTEGLVVFALNKNSEEELLKAFKERTIHKEYLLKVHGKVDISKIKPKMYLKKLENLSKVLISELKTSGYEEIRTNFEVVDYNDDNTTTLKAELITGKTHQIRAHIAYFGHYIIGDGKYGKENKSKMCLTAYLIRFSFKPSEKLYYLDGKEFSVKPTWWGK